MNRRRRASALIALCCAVAGAGLAGCEDDTGSSKADATSSADAGSDSSAKGAEAALFSGTKKLKLDGHSVNVSCSGKAAKGGPVVLLLHGGGDSLKKMAPFQKTLSAKNRVCSYDRLGAGASDKPEGKQSLEDGGKVITSVLDRVAGDRPVVLAGHSLGGLIAARYAPDHRDRVKGLVLMDATSPTQKANLTEEIPESATGPAADLREQTLAMLSGKSPEKLVVPDGEVRSAGSIPVEVVKHGKPYLEAVPRYGKGLERAWTRGQRKWLGVSSDSRLRVAKKSEHYIYADQPDIAVAAVQRVASRAGSGA